MRFDFSDLRLFEATARLGSISAGAEASNMALASASARISGMEKALGAKLLQRGRRGVSPTAAGRTLLQHARTILAQMEVMRGDLRCFATGLKGDIRILSNTAALVEVIPNALRVFLQSNPDVDIDVEERTSIETVTALLEGHAEFGVIAGTADTCGLAVKPLGIDRLTVIAAAGSALAARETVSFAEVLEEPFVGLSDGALTEHLAHHAAQLGKRINYRVRLRSFDAITRLVEAGIGVGIVPLAAAERHQGPGLAAIRLRDDWADRRLLVCARDFADQSPHACLFIDELQRASREEPARKAASSHSLEATSSVT